MFSKGSERSPATFVRLSGSESFCRVSPTSGQTFDSDVYPTMRVESFLQPFVLGLPRGVGRPVLAGVRGSRGLVRVPGGSPRVMGPKGLDAGGPLRAGALPTLSVRRALSGGSRRHAAGVDILSPAQSAPLGADEGPPRPRLLRAPVAAPGSVTENPASSKSKGEGGDKTSFLPVVVARAHDYRPSARSASLPAQVELKGQNGARPRPVAPSTRRRIVRTADATTPFWRRPMLNPR